MAVPTDKLRRLHSDLPVWPCSLAVLDSRSLAIRMKLYVWINGLSCFVSLARLDHAQDREAMVRLLNMSDVPVRHSASGESLVEIIPVIIGLAAAGVFNSHKDRRRAHDSNPPCESKDPLDTNDQDCSVTRWNSIVNYYPLHNNLVTMDHKVVQGADEVVALGSDIDAESDKNLEALAGPGDDVKKPSTTVGLIRDANVILGPVSQYLFGSGSTIIEHLADAQEMVSDHAAGDVQNLTSNLDTASERLQQRAGVAMDAQEVSAEANAAVMNSGATGALMAAVAGILSHQRTTSKKIADGSKAQLTVQTELTKALTREADQFERVFSAVPAVEPALRQATSDAAAAMQLTGQHAADESGQTAKMFYSNLAPQMNEVVNAILDQDRSVLADWRDRMKQAETDSDAAADWSVGKVDKLIDDQLGDSIKKELREAQQGVLDMTENLTRHIDQTPGALHAELGKYASLLSKIANEGVHAVISAGSTTNTHLSDSAVDARSKAQQVMDGSRSGVAALVQSLIAAVGGAQSDSGDRLTQREDELAGKSANLLSRMGTQSASIAGILADLARVVHTGTAAGMSSATQGYSQLGIDASDGGNRLTASLDTIGHEVGGLQSEMGSDFTSLMTTMSAAMQDGSGTLGAAMQGLSGASGDELSRLGVRRGQAESASLDKAESVRNRVAGLVRGIQGSVRDSSSAATVGRRDAESANDAVAALSEAIANGDDGLAAILRGQLSGALSKLPVDQRKVTDVSGLIRGMRDRQRDEEQAAGERETSVDRNDGRISSLRSEGGRLGSAIDGLAESSVSGQEGRESDFRARLTDLVNRGEGEIPDVNSTLMVGMDDSARKFVTDYIAKTSGSVRARVKDQRPESSQVTDVGLVVRNLQVASSALSDDLDDTHRAMLAGVLANLDSLDSNLVSSFSGNISLLSKSMSSAKATKVADLNAIMYAIEQSVGRLPETMAELSVMTSNEFSLASHELDNQINLLREQLATTDSAEKRAEIMGNLVVLERLRGVAEGVGLAGDQMHAEIASNASVAAEHEAHVQASMNSLIAAVSILSQNSVQATTSAINTRLLPETSAATATLINGLHLFLNQTSERLSNDAAQAAVASVYDMRFREIQAKAKLASVTANTTHAFTKAANSTDTTSGHESSFRDNVDSLLVGRSLSQDALTARLNAVLDAVGSDVSSLRTGSEESQLDVLTRLGIVRAATASFLGLWSEYANAVDRGTRVLVVADRDSIGTAETAAAESLTRDLAGITNAVTNARSAESEVEKESLNFADFETFFNQSVDSLVNDLKLVNTGRNDKRLSSEEGLNAVRADDVNTTRTVLSQVDALLEQLETDR